MLLISGSYIIDDDLILDLLLITHISHGFYLDNFLFINKGNHFCIVDNFFDDLFV
jgi:hypothetical protein